MEHGATHAINAAKEDTVRKVKQLTDDMGTTCAFDTTSRLGTIKDMIDCAAPGGTVATVGGPPIGSKLEIEPANWISRGVKYLGVHQGLSVPRQVSYDS